MADLKASRGEIKILVRMCLGVMTRNEHPGLHNKIET